jgi:site-specific recombinase XerC
MRSGRVRTRSGGIYTPRVILDNERVLDRHVVPELGGLRLPRVERGDLQRLVDDLTEQGREGRTIRNILTPLRVIYRRAIPDGEVAVSPCDNLRLPSAGGRQDRVTTP